MQENNRQSTETNIDLEALKEQAQRSGLTYNQAKQFIAETTGGRDTHIYSDTDVEAVKKQNKQARDTNRINKH